MFFTFTNENKSNEDILEVLFQDYYSRVYKVAYSILLNRELADDATQEAFLRAYKNMRSLKDKSKFGPWVYSIVTNVCKDMLKRIIVDRQKNMPIYDEKGNMKEFINELSDFNIPEKIYEDIELRQMFEDCINELDDDIRRIINLKYYQDLTYEEIADIMSIKEGTVKSKLHRANQKILKKFKKYTDMKGTVNGD